MKKWIFLLSLIFSNTIFATQASNVSSYVFAEALMWQIREPNAANWAQVVDPRRADDTTQFLGVPFKWRPGLRIGAGFNGPEQHWNVLLYYTGYKARGTNRANVDTGEELHSSFSSNFYANNPQGSNISGPYYHHGGIRWDVDFNTLDFELGRSFKIDNLVDLRPFAGLKAGRIDQTIHTNWTTPFQPTSLSNPNPVPITTFSSATETIRNDFKGLGPSVGLDTNWHLYASSRHAFDLVGNFSGAFLWGKWTFDDVYRNNFPQTISTVSDSLSSSAAMTRAYLGVEWSSVLNHANCALRLGYEAQVWFNQLQYYSFDMGKTNDPLYLQGVVLGFGVHF